MTLLGVDEPLRSIPLRPPGERIELDEGEAGIGRPRESSYSVSFILVPAEASVADLPC